MSKKVLFILKYREASKIWNDNELTYSNVGLSSGLFNSANFVNQALIDNDIDSELISVVDYNKINKEVHDRNPDVVIIEALWVTPTKLAELAKINPDVAWVIRNHSKIPFLGFEGMAMEYILEYSKIPNVIISSNHYDTNQEVLNLIKASDSNLSYNQASKKTCYLPNYYPTTFNAKPIKSEFDIVNIGCFGAIRPLKNHLIQAIAAIEYAKKSGKQLKFHINATRIEGRGDAILKNIRALFERIDNAELIEHEWMHHDDFIELIRTMDVGLQVSFSESFNIVAADFVNNHIPVVVSKEISWIDDKFHVDPSSVNDIVDKLFLALSYTSDHSKVNLETYNDISLEHWLNFINENNENTSFEQETLSFWHDFWKKISYSI